MTVPAGATLAVGFSVAAKDLHAFDRHGDRVWVTGRRTLIAGPAAPGPRAGALGAPAPVEAGITLC